jgi:hypothetical protein
MTSPSAGSTIGGSITLSATASDNVGVTHVEFYRDSGILLGSDTTSPYSMSFDTTAIADGSHGFYAKAYDAAGNASLSASVSVTISNFTASAPELIGFLPSVGNTRQVLANGNLAYVASDDFGLSLVDVSVPSAPVVQSSVDLPFNGSYLAAAGSLVCVTGQRAYHASPGVLTTVFGFYVIDVADASNPFVVGAIEGNSIGFNGVAMAGNYAYVACGSAGLKIIDLSDPSSPAIVGTYDSPGWAQSVTVAGNYAYLADSSQGLRIIDVSNSTAPISVGWVDTPSSAKDVCLVGSTAYVSDNTSMQIIDVSNVSAPVIRGSAPVGALQTKVINGIAYIAASSAGLVIYNVSNPASPSLLGSLPPSGGPNASTQGLFVEGSIAYLANFDGGLGLASVSVPSSPSVAGRYMEWFEGSKIAVKPGIAVVTGAQFWNGGSSSINGLRVLNTDSPGAPFVVGKIDSALFGLLGVAVSGNYAYVACGGAGLKVVDISIPSLPVIVGTYDTPGWAQAVAISGNYAFVADGTQGLRILDVQNASAPAFVGWVDTPGNARGVAVEGTTAYVADNTSVQIVDVSNPAAPIIRGSYAPAGFTALEVKVQNSVAYVAASSGGLVIVDVSNPAGPVRLGSILPSGGPNASTQGVDVLGSSAYLANFDGGLAIVDVSSPTAPTLRNSVLTVGNVRGVTCSGNWIYLSDTRSTISTVYQGP